ncbi:MAG TPA: hypothetical protein VLA64_01460 [Azonexus sp.]|nr:hypothetical protein [Azonexus sp.]
MKKILFAVLLAASTTVAIAADVGVSVSIGQPGFYGQIDIGGYPQPQVIYRQPRAIYYVPPEREPLYLHVPPGHAKNWKKHCRGYNACNERVYFVRDNWYNTQYVPRYQERNRGYRDDRRGDNDNGYRGDERRGNNGNGHRGDDHRGNGHGNDHGNDHGHGKKN